MWSVWESEKAQLKFKGIGDLVQQLMALVNKMTPILPVPSILSIYLQRFLRLLFPSAGSTSISLGFAWFADPFRMVGSYLARHQDGLLGYLK